MGQLTLKTKLSYGSGDFGFALTTTMLALVFAIFLTDVVGISPTLAAMAIFIGRTWDYISDPIAGYITDRTRTRWGKRRPYLLFGAIPFGFTFAMMWWIPPIASEMGLAVYYSAMYFLFDTVLTFTVMPYFALTPELADDYDGRTTLTSFRMVFSILGSMAAFILPMMIIGEMHPSNTKTIMLVGAGMGLASCLPFFLVFAGTREKTEHIEREKSSLLDSIKAAVRNKPFLFAIIIYLCTITGFDIMQATLLFFMKYQLNMEHLADKIFATLFVMALLSIPGWNYLAKKLDKSKAYIIAMVFISLIMISFTMMDSSAPVWLVFTLAGLCGIGFAAAQTLPWAIIPDSVEYDEYLTGKRHEGMFYSMTTLFRKIASSLAVPSALLILGATGYVPNAESQTENCILTIRLFTGAVPALLFFIGIIAAWKYPLTRKKFREIQEVLDKRRNGTAVGSAAETAQGIPDGAGPVE